MAETRVKKESTAPKALAAKLWPAGQGWITDNNRALSVFHGRGQDLSYKTHDFRRTQTPLPEPSSSSATRGRAGSRSSSSAKHKAWPQHRLHTPVLESFKHHGSALEQQGVGITVQSRAVSFAQDLPLAGGDET